MMVIGTQRSGLIVFLFALVTRTTNGFHVGSGRLPSMAPTVTTRTSCMLSRVDGENTDVPVQRENRPSKMAAAAAVALAVFMGSMTTSSQPTWAANDGASSVVNSKITTGGASTLQSGRTIAITRGVNLDNADFSGQNLKGVAFQQSIVRNANFKDCNLVGASFFDATLDGSNFENADMTLANVEMAQFQRASLKNAVLSEMYVSGATLFDGIASIENSDWSETYLRADQRKYLCNHPTAFGVNPQTGMETRDSLMCPPSK